MIDLYLYVILIIFSVLGLTLEGNLTNRPNVYMIGLYLYVILIVFFVLGLTLEGNLTYHPNVYMILPSSYMLLPLYSLFTCITPPLCMWPFPDMHNNLFQINFKSICKAWLKKILSWGVTNQQNSGLWPLTSFFKKILNYFIIWKKACIFGLLCTCTYVNGHPLIEAKKKFELQR